MIRKINEARNIENDAINKKIATTIRTKLYKDPKYRADLEAEGFELFNNDGSEYGNWEVRGTNGNTVCLSKGYDNKPRIYDGYSPVATKDSIDDFDFYNYLTLDMTGRRDYRQHGGRGKTNTIGGELINRDGSAVDANFAEPSKTQQYKKLKRDISDAQRSKQGTLKQIQELRDKIDTFNRYISANEEQIDKKDALIAAKLDEIDKLLKDMKVRLKANESTSRLKNIKEDAKDDFNLARPNHSKLLKILDNLEISADTILNALLSYVPDPTLKDFTDEFVNEYLTDDEKDFINK